MNGRCLHPREKTSVTPSARHTPNPQSVKNAETSATDNVGEYGGEEAGEPGEERVKRLEWLERDWSEQTGKSGGEEIGEATLRDEPTRKKEK